MTIVVWPEQPAEWVAAIRQAAGGTAVVTPTSEAAAVAAAPAASGWIGRVTREMLVAAPQLRWLQSPTISLESVIIPELVDSDITLTNMRNIYNDHIANHVLAFFLAHCRDLPQLIRRQVAGEWAPMDEVQVLDPGAMTVLVMGLGGIGSETVRRLAVFGPTIIGVDPKVQTAPAGVDSLHRPDELAELLPRADAVIICAPQTPETTGLFGATLFGRMKLGSLFINIGRGKIVQLAALEAALRAGRVARAALDVFETEPLPTESALWGMPQVIITPHCAGAGPHTEERRLGVIVENVRRFVADRALVNVADKERWY